MQDSGSSINQYGDLAIRDLVQDVLVWVPQTRVAMNAICHSCSAMFAATTTSRSWLKLQFTCRNGCHVRVHRLAERVRVLSQRMQPSCIARLSAIASPCLCEFEFVGGFKGPDRTRALIGEACRHPFLKRLDLSDTSVDSATLDVIVKRAGKKLEELSLRRDWVHDVNMLTLCKKLRRLDLSETQVDSAGIQWLHLCPSLTELALSGVKSLEDVNALGACRTLEVLDVSNCERLDVIGVRCLRHCERLHSISMCGTLAMDEGWHGASDAALPSLPMLASSALFVDRPLSLPLPFAT